MAEVEERQNVVSHTLNAFNRAIGMAGSQKINVQPGSDDKIEQLQARAQEHLRLHDNIQMAFQTTFTSNLFFVSPYLPA